ncbi:hypothetical protein ACIP39_09410 [Streptomyces tibetensis]|uniref:hypothetical protein n=1 Tax=Streptomyces tibetensis TaxID=2382123 RepID=UPI003808618C
MRVRHTTLRAHRDRAAVVVQLHVREPKRASSAVLKIYFLESFGGDPTRLLVADAGVAGVEEALLTHSEAVTSSTCTATDAPDACQIWRGTTGNNGFCIAVGQYTGAASPLVS